MPNKKRKAVIPPAKIEGQYNFSIKEENEKRFECPFCGTLYASNSNVKRHIASGHFSHGADIEFIECYTEEKEDDKDDDAENDEEEYDKDDDEEYNEEDDDDYNEDEEEEEEEEDLNERHLYNTIQAQMTNVEDDNGEVLGDKLLERIATATVGKNTVWNNFTEGTHPFPNIESMVMHAFVDGDNDMIPRRILRKILFTFNLLLTIKDKATENKREFKLPTVNTLLNYQTLVKNKISVFPTKEIKVALNNDTNNGLSINAGLNLPSDHLKLLMANPKKSNTISSVPDRSTNMSICLQQGEKWRTNFFFQQPMWRINGIDYWYGDMVRLFEGPWRVDFLIESFHSCNETMKVRGYKVRHSPTSHYVGIEVEYTDFNVSELPVKKEQQLNPELCCSISRSDSLPLNDVHKSLIKGDHYFKKKINEGTEEFYQVKIAPIILFTDDTSGNRSKQYNAYESWSMKCGALSFEERSSIENINFISAIPKKDGASGISLLRTIAEDLKQLEKGLIMYSAEEKKNVLVVSPVLWIEADNPCHSELCGLLGPTTLFSCRKCYIRLRRSKNLSLAEVKYYTGKHTNRTRDHYCIASRTANRSSTIANAPNLGDNLSASDLSYRNRSTDILLELQAFDPAKDTPVEILHGILLGISKYLIMDLVKVVLKGDKTGKIKQLSDAIKLYQNNAGVSRKFTKKLQHCGSFLGRDFKLLVQILPAVLLKYFKNNPVLKEITKAFVELGKLCSLIFVRKIESDFTEYLDEVNKAVYSLIKSLYSYDTDCKIKNHKPYCSKLKVHLLTHLVDDIKRFGPALNFETERGEQFNKHIREHLFFTNRLETSRDIARKFGKQSVFKLVLDGGSWVNKEGLREKYGTDIANFISSKEEYFFFYLGGETREFEDNSDITNDIKENSFGVFELHNSNQPFLGLVSSPYVQKFGLINENEDYKNGYYLKAMAVKSSYSIPLNTLNVKLILDASKCENGIFDINLNKFGTYWYFKRNASYLT